MLGLKYMINLLFISQNFSSRSNCKKTIGFLMPQVIDSSSLGLSFKLPYYKVISDNKDLTFTTRIFSENEILLKTNIDK